MIPWLRVLIYRIIWDASWPERALRTTIATVGGLIQAGQIPFPQGWEWAGSIVMAFALAIPAGQMNKDKDATD